ncbi:hypothetical protein P9112_011961 [Eukaryota sp. TZLM1-RC]
MGCGGSKGAVHDIVICGLSNAGKTTLIKRLAHQDKDLPQLESVPTIGLNTEKIVLENTSFNLLDMSGAKPFRGHWRSYFPSASIIVFVIDASDYENLSDALQTLREHVLSIDSSKGKPLLILANKNDKKGSLSADQISRHLSSVMGTTSERQYLIVSSSGVTGNGVEKIIQFLLQGR